MVVNKINFFGNRKQVTIESLKDIFRKVFSANNSLEVNFLNTYSNESMLHTANNLLQYGWRKEAIPVSQVKKSILARFFDAIFN